MKACFVQKDACGAVSAEAHHITRTLNNNKYEQRFNPSHEATDILLFGGEPYTEPIVAEGPFVMNSRAEIADAYRDFYAGKYGEINLQKGKV